MKANVEIGDLLFEVTRRCNMRCGHCLRGSAQPKDMDMNVVHRFMEIAKEQRIHIYSLASGGGEPTMKVELLAEIFGAVHDASDPSFWYVTSNGKGWTEETVLELQNMASRHSNTMDSMNAFAISMDEFHERLKGRDMDMVSRLREEMSDAKVETKHGNPWGSTHRYDSVLNAGRAKKLWNKPKRKSHHYQVDVVDRDPNEEWIDYEIPMVYVTVDGDMLSDCDMSYADMKSQAKHDGPQYLGNVFTMAEPLIEAAKRKLGVYE
jgi:organic radical activating enzyme